MPLRHNKVATLDGALIELLYSLKSAGGRLESAVGAVAGRRHRHGRGHTQKGNQYDERIQYVSEPGLGRHDTAATITPA
jgi:hypothetical protein